MKQNYCLLPQQHDFFRRQKIPAYAKAQSHTINFTHESDEILGLLSQKVFRRCHDKLASNVSQNHYKLYLLQIHFRTFFLHFGHEETEGFILSKIYQNIYKICGTFIIQSGIVFLIRFGHARQISHNGQPPLDSRKTCR